MSTLLASPTFTDRQVTNAVNYQDEPFYSVVFNTDGVALIASRDDKNTFLALTVHNSPGYGRFQIIESCLIGKWRNKKADKIISLYLDIGRRLVELRSHGWALGFQEFNHLHVLHPASKKSRLKIKNTSLLSLGLRLCIRRLDSLLADPVIPTKDDEGWKQMVLERGSEARKHLLLRQALIDHDDLSVEQLLELVERSIAGPLDSPCLAGSLEFHRKAMQAEHFPQDQTHARTSVGCTPCPRK